MSAAPATRDASDEAFRFPPYAAAVGARTETVHVTCTPLAGGLASYDLRTTLPQRDDQPRERRVAEAVDAPSVRSGHLLFDALFAQAVDDARLLAVDAIRDGAYDEGRAIAAQVFQTGEFWTYVWTRDLAYAADLGLAWHDPQRVVRSLRFKTSGWREGLPPVEGLPAGSRQIVQDTGSGGSWPVSTDRVSWARAAAAVLDALPAAERGAFAAEAFAALQGTVEADRAVAFDPRCGLYGGEPSFLDWRTQTHAPWIVDDLTLMCVEKALSTNVGHHAALQLIARLAAERGDAEAAARYRRWADALAQAIDRVFWLPDVRRYASLTTPDNVPLHQFDMLGTALAVLAGIAPDERARDALAHYPHAPFGVPVIEPQQAGVYVYHNRAIWPFVTAYALRAAVQVDNPVLAQHAIDSLMRGAALHLSNMENLEWLTATSRHDDGPRINSRRQLWSVGAYLGMVAEGVFGLHLRTEGLHVAPYLTAATRRLFGDAAVAELRGLRFQGAPLSITLQLPPVAAGEGRFEVAEVTLDGQPVAGPISAATLAAGAGRIAVRFGALGGGRDTRIARVPEVPSTSHDDARVFAPPAPVVEALDTRGAHAVLHLAPGPAPDTRLVVFRDGQAVATILATENGAPRTSWVDPLPRVPGRRRRYSVEAISAQGLHSHHCAPLADDADATQFIPVIDPRVRSNVAPTPAGDGLVAPTLRDWGRPADRFEIDGVPIARTGRYAISLVYNAHHQDIETGVTAAVKRLVVCDAQGRECGAGALAMPNVRPQGEVQPLRASTELEVELPAGACRFALSDGFNMSCLQSNARYSGAGGVAGPLNRVHLAGLRIVAL